MQSSRGSNVNIIKNVKHLVSVRKRYVLFTNLSRKWLKSSSNEYGTVKKKFSELDRFLLSSIYIRRKYWIRENFRLPVFDGFTCFEMS